MFLNSYVGVNGEAHKIKKIYQGVNGKAKLIYNPIATGDGGMKLTPQKLNFTNGNRYRIGVSFDDLGVYWAPYSNLSAKNSYYETFNKDFICSLVKDVSPFSLETDWGNCDCVASNDYGFFAGQEWYYGYNYDVFFFNVFRKSTGTQEHYFKSDSPKTCGGVRAMCGAFNSGYIYFSTSPLVEKDGALYCINAETRICFRYDNLLRLGRAYKSATSIGNYIIFAGGYRIYDEVCTSYVTAYNKDIVATNCTSLTYATSELASEHNNNYAIFAGGFSGSDYETDRKYVYAYNSSLVQTKPTSLSSSKSLNHTSTCTLGDCVIFANGYEADNRAVEVYNNSLVKTLSDDIPTGVGGHPRGGISFRNRAIFEDGGKTAIYKQQNYYT